MVIKFKNGSLIETLETNSKPVRGYGSKLPSWYNDCDICYDREIVGEVLKPFCKKKLSDRIKYLKQFLTNETQYDIIVLSNK